MFPFDPPNVFRGDKKGTLGKKESKILTLCAPTPQNGQTHSDNSSAKAEEL